MATSETKVTAGQILSATVKYNNNDDASRVYDISANVRIENGTAQSFDSGEVRAKGSTADTMTGEYASFNSWGENELSMTFNNATPEKRTAMLNAVNAFIADVKASIVVNPITV